MLQVPPTGLQPSRPVVKVTHAEPVDPGFSAIALLAASQAPAPTQPAPTRGVESTSGTEAREASVSHPSAEPGRSSDAKPVHSREEESEEPRKDGSPAPVEGLPADANQAGVAPASVDPGSAQAQVTAPALPLPMVTGSLPQPESSASKPGDAAAPVAPSAVQWQSEVPALAVPAPPPDPSRVAGTVTQDAESAVPGPGQPAAPADFPSTLTATPAEESPATGAATAALPAVAKTARAGTARNIIGMPPDPLAEAGPAATRLDRGSASDSGAAPRTGPRVSLPPALNAELPAAGSFRPTQPEIPFQAPPALPVNVRFSGPAGPARPADIEPAAKEGTRTGESQRPAEATPSHRNDAATPAAESAAGRPAQAGAESATALPRSESLGLQPSQMHSAAPSGSPIQVAARAETAATWQVPVPPVLQQVENGIRWMLRNASPGAELQLHPEALGRVRIELKVEGGDVHARLWASDPKSIPVLQEHKAFLEVSLKEQGLNLGSFDLRQNSNQAHPGLTDGQSRGQFWPTEAGAAEPRQDAPTQSLSRSANPRRIELIA